MDPIASCVESLRHSGRCDQDCVEDLIGALCCSIYSNCSVTRASQRAHPTVSTASPQAFLPMLSKSSEKIAALKAFSPNDIVVTTELLEKINNMAQPVLLLWPRIICVWNTVQTFHQPNASDLQMNSARKIDV